jgi:hypothetical protein
VYISKPAIVAIAWLVALSWIWKVIAAIRGLPTIPNLLAPEHDQTPAGVPSITVIVPARDEAADIAATPTPSSNRTTPTSESSPSTTAAPTAPAKSSLH